MNFVEAIEGAESHYERGEYIEAIALTLVGFGRLVEEQSDEATPEWRRMHHSLCDDPVGPACHPECILSAPCRRDCSQQPCTCP